MSKMNGLKTTIMKKPTNHFSYKCIQIRKILQKIMILLAQIVNYYLISLKEYIIRHTLITVMAEILYYPLFRIIHFKPLEYWLNQNYKVIGGNL